MTKTNKIIIKDDKDLIKFIKEKKKKLLIVNFKKYKVKFYIFRNEYNNKLIIPLKYSKCDNNDWYNLVFTENITYKVYEDKKELYDFFICKFLDLQKDVKHKFNVWDIVYVLNLLWIKKRLVKIEYIHIDNGNLVYYCSDKDIHYEKEISKL